MAQPVSQGEIDFFSKAANEMKADSFYRPVSRREALFMGIFLLAAGSLFRLSPLNGYASGDPYGSLLLSQTILHHGSVDLSTHPEEITGRYSWQIFERNGRLLYGYPLGTPVLMVPFVGLANIFSMDMRKPHLEIECQRHLAAVSAAVVLLLIYLLGRCFFDPGPAFALTVVFGLGGGVASSMGIALFSLNLEVVFILWSMLLLTREHLGIRRLNPYLLGILLFFAYFCRPTAAFFIAGVLVFLFFLDRRIMFKTAAAAFVPFVCLTLYSLWIYGKHYPSFYNLNPHAFTHFSWAHVYGLLMSPSRGLLVFSPFLLVIFIGAAIFFRRISRRPLFWLGLGSFLAVFALICHWRTWWGGGSFGYRLLLDGYPGLILVSFLVVREGTAVKSRGIKPVGLIALVLLGGCSILVNSALGLFNPATERWNYALEKYDNNPILFDWSHPQFITSDSKLNSRSTRLGLAKLAGSIAVGSEVGLDQEAVFYDGFGAVEQDDSGKFRWSERKETAVWINLARKDPFPPGSKGEVIIYAGTFGAQSIQVFLNGDRLGVLKGSGDPAPSEYRFSFPPKKIGLFDTQRIARVKLEFFISEPLIPSRVDPNSRDDRLLGLKLYSLSFRYRLPESE